jgi:hypothetical protein
MSLENVVLLLIGGTLVIANVVLGTWVAPALAGLFGRRRRRGERAVPDDVAPRSTLDSEPPEHPVSRVRLSSGRDVSASDRPSAGVGGVRR